MNLTLMKVVSEESPNNYLVMVKTSKYLAQGNYHLESLIIRSVMSQNPEYFLVTFDLTTARLKYFFASSLLKMNF